MDDPVAHSLHQMSGTPRSSTQQQQAISASVSCLLNDNDTCYIRQVNVVNGGIYSDALILSVVLSPPSPLREKGGEVRVEPAPFRMGGQRVNHYATET